MTMLPPFLPQSIRYGNVAFPDVEPFSLRAAASYEEIQYSVVTWIRDQLMPWIADNSAGTTWQTAADALTKSVNDALAAEAADFASRYGTFFLGSIVAPAATGDPTQDTPNLQNAISQAQTSGYDLHLTPSQPSALGVVVKNYKLNAPLSWSLAKGSLIGTGEVGLDFSPMSTSYNGAALTLTGEGGDFSNGAHQSALHRLEGFKVLGHDTDTSIMDGIRLDDPLGNVDQGHLRSVMIYGFRDNVTFGSNVWSIDFYKCAIANAHRYGLNLSMGTNAGECISFTNTSIYGCSNASKTAAAIWAPNGTNVEFRMIGGSLDYNNLEGKIEGGNLTFTAVHIEDSNTGPMFTYQNTAGVESVSFRDCSWDSSATAARDVIHSIVAANTGGKIHLSFTGDKGGLYPNTYSKWLKNFGAASVYITATLRDHYVDGSYLYGQIFNLLTNGDFDSSSSFVAQPGIGGWSIPGVGTWTIESSGGSTGNALKLVSTTSANYVASQRIRIPTGRPLSIGGKMQIQALSAGNVQIGVQFYAGDGTTPIGGAIRIGNTYSTVDAANWAYTRYTLTPPPGAEYAVVQLTGGSFVGTALWDQIEVVPL